MFLIPLINVMAQAVAALLIFVVGYIVLLLCAIAGLIIANLIYRAARLSWSYVMARRASSGAQPAKIAEIAHMHFPKDDILNHRVVLVRRSSL